MQSEQVMFEGRNCPYRQKFVQPAKKDLTPFESEEDSEDYNRFLDKLANERMAEDLHTQGRLF